MSEVANFLSAVGMAGRGKLARVKASLVLCTVLLGSVFGCSHPLEIVGEGDIVSSSGTHDCTLEEFEAGNTKCKDNYVIGAYSEVYTAVPRANWVFKGWQTYCAYASLPGICTFNAPANLVFQNWGNRLNPLRAEFIPDCTGVPGCVDALPPHLGAVTDTSIKVWQTTRDEAELELRYHIPGNPTWTTETLDIDATTGWVGAIQVTGLQPDTLYEYETWLNGALKHSSTFTTLPSAGWTGQLRFGFATDLGHLYNPFKTLGHAAARDYHFMLMIGDLMYADQSPTVANTVDAYSERYWLTWNESNFSTLGSSTPLFMMWDDHEIFNDFYPGLLAPGESQSRYPAAREAYDRYPGAHNPDTNGVAYYPFSAPGADFFVLDTRSFRSPSGAIDDAQKTMLGQGQFDTLLDYLEQSTAPFKFIVSSVPFTIGELAADTWSSFQTERALLLSEIELRGITGVAFLSGDRHWSGAFRFTSAGGYDYYEFLPSPAGSYVRTGTAPPMGINDNEIVIFSNDTDRTFGDYQLDLSGATPSLRAAFIDAENNELCAITITSDETGVFGGAPAASCE